MSDFNDNLFDVNTTGVEKMGGFEIYPAGLYPAIMVSAAKKPTKDGSGGFIECVYQFIDGDVSGKKFTSRMNLWNSNAQAVGIAKRELKSLRAALGLADHVSALSEFVNKPVVLNITVKQRKNEPPGSMENNLVAIEPYNGAGTVVHPATQSQPQAPVAPQFGNTVAPQPQQQWQPPQQQPAQQGFYQPQQQAFAQQPQQGQMPPPAFQPNGSAPPPWAQR